MDPDDTVSLSSLITLRTGGNVYFSLQLLEKLRNEKLLDYSFTSCRWKWNLDKLRADTDVTDNVGLVLTSKIRQLPPNVQSVLQLGACLGFYFDVDVLQRIAMQGWATSADASERHLGESVLTSPLEAFRRFSIKDGNDDNSFRLAIDKAVEENLLDHVSGTKYKFAHDRVLQASYEMHPAGRERDLLHWRIGEVLWSELKQQRNGLGQDAFLLFATTDQLNRGSDH